MIVTEKAHGRTRFFLGTVVQFGREWDNFTSDRSKAKTMTESEARDKAAELNEKHAEYAAWCKFNVSADEQIKNQQNEYAAALGAMLDECPKAVLAAIAVSALTCGGDYLDEARVRVAKEWKALFDQRIVPQKPGKSAREALSLSPAPFDEDPSATECDPPEEDPDGYRAGDISPEAQGV